MAVGFRKSNNGYGQGPAPVSVVQLEGFSPDKIVDNIRYDQDVLENSYDYGEIVQIFPDTTATGYLIERYETHSGYSIDYLVTEKVSPDNTPLFYSYELKYDVTSLTEQDILQLYRNNETVVDPSEYLLEYANISLHNNYNGTYSDTLDRYGSGVAWTTNFNSASTVHRVRVLLPKYMWQEEDFYTVRYTKNLWNLDDPNHVELVEIEKVYDNANYVVSSGNLVLTDNSLIPTSSNFLYVTRNPRSVIRSEGLFSLKTQSYQNDAGTSWNIRINTGSFLLHNDPYGSGAAYFNCEFVQGNDLNEGRYQPSMYIKPKMRAGNVLKVEETPIYIKTDLYIYPDYEIQVFPRDTDLNIIPTGTIGIDIDGAPIKNIAVSSIDRDKGYFLLSRALRSEDEIDMFFYHDVAGEMLLRNLELNPRVDAIYGFGPNKDTSFSNIGIAMRALPNGGLGDDSALQASYKYPYFFDFDEPNTFYQGDPIPQETTTSTVTGTLRWNPYGSNDPSGAFIPIAHLSLNKLTPDAIKITDARVIGGGLSEEFFPEISNNQRNSYVDMGYYDGEPLPEGSLVIIHIPRSKFNDLVTTWKDSNMFNPELYTDVSVDELREWEITASGEYEEYYNNLLQGKPAGRSTDSSYKEPYSEMLDNWAKAEASRYIDQLIKRYISAGSQYILLDENFTQIRLDV